MSNLNKVKEILLRFQTQLEKKKSFYDLHRPLNPNFSPLSEDNCQKELAHCWIYGTDDIGAILKAPLPKIPYLTDVSKSQAFKHYKNWQIDIEKNGIAESYYNEYFINDEQFANYHLDEPKRGETLYDYVLRLQEIIESKEKIHFLWERALSSFLHYLRQKIPKDQIAFLELIFPEDMEIRRITTFKKVQIEDSNYELIEVPFNQIIRKISPCVYPTYILTSANILNQLANTVLYDRQNAKMTAAETLGLCWICLTAARLRLPISLKNLFNLPKDALERLLMPSLSLPTLFGYLPMSISEIVWEFLKAISDIPSKESRPTIFQSSEESFYRCLRRTIKKLNLDASKGKITFQTFLSQPQEFDHRYQPR